jgi:hypothetical protein
MKRKGQKGGSLASRTVWQSVLFLAVFYAVWPIQFAAFVVPTVPSNYWIYLLAAILGPLQGFLNALVVFCRDRRSIQRRVSQNMRKLLPRRSTKSTNTGSSALVSAVLAVGKEVNQPVEHSVKSEVAAQLEIGVGQIDRLDDEENTPEHVLHSDGSVSDTAPVDTCNDGLLEHAMSCGLLNDDDREIFRGTIERIQSSRLVLGE